MIDDRLGGEIENGDIGTVFEEPSTRARFGTTVSIEVASPLMIVTTVSVRMNAGASIHMVEREGGFDEYDGAAVQLNVKLTLGWAGSLLDRTRVSTNGVDALDPVGGVHTIEIVDGGDPWFKLEIGRDPDEIENHDPDANDPD